MRKTDSHKASRPIITLTLSHWQITFKEALPIYITAMKTSKKHTN